MLSKQITDCVIDIRNFGKVSKACLYVSLMFKFLTYKEFIFVERTDVRVPRKL